MANDMRDRLDAAIVALERARALVLAAIEKIETEQDSEDMNNARKAPESS